MANSVKQDSNSVVSRNSRYAPFPRVNCIYAALDLCENALQSNSRRFSHTCGHRYQA